MIANYAAIRFLVKKKKTLVSFLFKSKNQNHLLFANLFIYFFGIFQIHIDISLQWLISKSKSHRG